MIKITISRTKLGSIQSFKMTGHADYAPHGQDLVCAGTTAVVFGSINAVEELCNVQATIELGMKVSVRRSNRDRVAVVTRIEGDYVFVRWTHSELAESEEYQAHRDDVTPLAGWL